MRIDYSKLQSLNVRYNNSKSRDYTDMTLPSGDMTPVTFSPGTAAAAAMAYSPGIHSTSLMASYLPPAIRLLFIQSNNIIPLNVSILRHFHCFGRLSLTSEVIIALIFGLSFSFFFS